MRIRPMLAAVLVIPLSAPLVALAIPGLPGQPSASPTPLLVAAARDTEPVVLTGDAFGSWAAPANVTAKLPLTDLESCRTFDEACAHNHYAKPEVDSANFVAPKGTPTDLLSGWRWDPATKAFSQVPFQIDKRFVRYLDNSASGFAVYSGEDQHLSYQFDREGFRYTASSKTNPCRALPDSPVALDPIQGLDTNDEVAFMAADAGPAAPQGAALPAGATAFKTVTLRDPEHPDLAPTHLYVMLGHVAPLPKSRWYVHYLRDANADQFAFSQSSYSGYGDAAKGVYCDELGHVVRDAHHHPKIDRRRPLDTATVTTDRYTYRYDGRWLMTGIRISPDGGKTYGPNIVDRWKARAFAQDPGSKTPCCGYEEEDTNWGGSSTLMGERVGPVRAIRETWGADSGTNVVRRETFYRDEMRMRTFLRVHVIPPLDGIYAQWDYRAGMVDRFYNTKNPGGVPIDGKNDTLVGNFDDPCNPTYDSNTTSRYDQSYRSLYRDLKLCQASPYHFSVNPSDPTFSDANAALGWTVVTGKYGTVVSRIQLDPTAVTPGGLAQSIVAVPYYRDDSCFDDGTGSDPGPKVHLRSGDEPAFAPDGVKRKCWTPADGIPTAANASHFFQGDIGTNGMHLLFLVDSDNARQTVPIDEIVFEQRQVFLPGRHDATAGARYGQQTEKPLLTTVS